MTRPSDLIHNKISYTVHEKAGHGLFVKGSHFQPGYTEAYKETAEEALQFAINVRLNRIHELTEEIQVLRDLLEKESNA
jgi:hypothetical protein